MRLYIHTDVKDKPKMHFPWNYHLSFMSFIYEALGNSNPELASELHQKEHAPPFCFSDFIQTGPYEATNNGLFFTKGHFTISSTNTDIIRLIQKHIPDEGTLNIGNTQVPVIGQTIEETNGVSGESQYQTLSPIATGELPYDKSTDGQREWYLPSDLMWASRVQDSVESNMKNEVGLPDDFKFRVVDYDWVDKKVKRINDEIEIPCSRLSLTIDADERTSEFIQNFGVGERTGMGFGSIIQEDMLKQKYR